MAPSRADTLCRSENGGLCEHCSRDLPLDRRLLFVAELTGRKWWVVSVTLRRWSVLDIRFTGGSRSLRDYQPEMGLNVRLPQGCVLRRACDASAFTS